MIPVGRVVYRDEIVDIWILLKPMNMLPKESCYVATI